MTKTKSKKSAKSKTKGAKMPATKSTFKNKSFGSSISLSSNKGRLIVFLLAFAVIGGGFMLYRSFASENVITNYQDKISGINDATRITEKSGKSGLTVWQIYKTQGTVASKFTITPWVTLNTYMLCATVRNAGTQYAYFKIQDNISTPNGTRKFYGQFGTPPSTGYNEFCTPAVSYPASNTPYEISNAGVQVTTGSGSNPKLNVSNISLRW